MNILVANLGSTSLKWRLFDCANSAERLVHKGGFERVTEYSKAIEDCLGQLRDAGAIATERNSILLCDPEKLAAEAHLAAGV